MIHWVMLNPNGTAFACGSAFELPDNAYRVPDPLDPATLAVVMVVGLEVEEREGMRTIVGGEWHHRPKLAELVADATGFTLPECPEGTTVIVSDAATGASFGTTVGTGEPLQVSLPDQGLYTIEVHPPMPWQKPEPAVVEIAG